MITPQSGCLIEEIKSSRCFWTDPGGRKRDLLYIGKLTEPECDSLVLQNIDISQQYTGWGIFYFFCKWPLYLILLTCCHNKGLNFRQTPRDTHYQDGDSHPAENEWLSSTLCRQIQSVYQQCLRSDAGHAKVKRAEIQLFCVVFTFFFFFTEEHGKFWLHPDRVWYL